MEISTEQNIQESKPKELAVGVQFHTAGKIYTFITTEASFAAGDIVVVESEGGALVGCVVHPPKEVAEGEIPQNAKRALRRASKEEIDCENTRCEKAMEYFAVCRKKIHEHGLQMKLVDAQIEENGKKAVFVFFSEQRIDFRMLVKDLAGALHMRIEMRQIGARDEAKYKACIGPCGLATCCSLYLRQFQSISISMAKHQGLAPNPAKLTGMCGKLKCCLAYEHDVYNEYRKDLPKIGVAVSSPHGAGKVTGHNVLKRECVIRLFGDGECRSPAKDCAILDAAAREAAIAAAKQAEESSSEDRARRTGRGRSRNSGGTNGRRENSVSRSRK